VLLNTIDASPYSPIRLHDIADIAQSSSSRI
jgi:hypothetical protein